jgi:hypothetical protein
MLLSKVKSTDGLQAGSGQSAENNSGSSSKKQKLSKIKSDTGNGVMKGIKMKMTILISKDTDLDKLGKDLITESNTDNPKPTQLMINNARTFKIDKIEKLGKIIANIPLEVDTHALEDIDIKEFIFTLVCHNNDMVIPPGVKINMDSIEPISDEELKRISEIIANLTGKDVEEILEYYKNKDVIDPRTILHEKQQ